MFVSERIANMYALIAESSLTVAMETTRSNCSTYIGLGHVPQCVNVSVPVYFKCVTSMRETVVYASADTMFLLCYAMPVFVPFNRLDFKLLNCKNFCLL